MSYSRYQILIKNPAGEVLADLSDRCLRRYYKLRRNRSSLIELLFDVDDLRKMMKQSGTTIDSIFQSNVNEVYIIRQGTTMASGQIYFQNVNVPQDDRRVVRIQAPGWLELFNKRYTGASQTYTATDLGAIMWDLIDTSQTETNGDFGITQGTIQTSRTGDRSYSYKKVKDAIIQLSEVLGAPDFEITGEKVFNAYYPKQGRRRTEFAFTYPGNVVEISYDENGDEMANQIIASGSGTGQDRLLSVQSDTAAQPTYKLRQEVIQFPDISLQDTLDSHALEEVRAKSSFLIIPTIRVKGDAPQLGSYGLGDEVEIKIKKDLELFSKCNGIFRIDEIEVTIDENNVEDVKLKLGR